MKNFNEEIDNNFRFHSLNDCQIEKYKVIEDNTKALAKLLNSICPDSREKSLSITRLEECVMWATVSIARNE